MAAVVLAARWGSNLTGCFVDPSTRMLRGANDEPMVLGLPVETRAHDGDAFDPLERRRRPPADFDPFVYPLHHPITAKPQDIRAWSDLAGDILFEEACDAQVDLPMIRAYGHSPSRK